MAQLKPAIAETTPSPPQDVTCRAASLWNSTTLRQKATATNHGSKLSDDQISEAVKAAEHAAPLQGRQEAPRRVRVVIRDFRIVAKQASDEAVAVQIGASDMYFVGQMRGGRVRSLEPIPTTLIQSMLFYPRSFAAGVIERALMQGGTVAECANLLSVALQRYPGVLASVRRSMLSLPKIDTVLNREITVAFARNAARLTQTTAGYRDLTAATVRKLGAAPKIKVLYRENDPISDPMSQDYAVVSLSNGRSRTFEIVTILRRHGIEGREDEERYLFSPSAMCLQGDGRCAAWTEARPPAFVPPPSYIPTPRPHNGA